MFKPTAPQCSRLRLRLTTKAVNKGYYKGNRTGSMGAHTPHGRYIIDYRKVRTYVCPEPATFEKFKLTPFVTKEMEPRNFMRTIRDPTTGELTEVEVKEPDGMNGHDFLNEWNEQNPEEVREETSRSEEDIPEETEPVVIFGRTWDELPAAMKSNYQNKPKVWEQREGAKERLASKWYGKLEEQTKGKGLGGPSRRKIRA